MEQARTVNKIVMDYITTDLQIKALESEQATRKEKIVARYSQDLTSKELTTKTHTLLIKYTTKPSIDTLTIKEQEKYNELNAIIEQAKKELKELEKKATRKNTGFSLTVKAIEK